MSKEATSTKRERNPAATRQKLVDATVQLMLKQGFAGTSVDDICAVSGLTKGSFFHHFDSKEAIGKAAVEWWGQFGASLYAPAWLDEKSDPLERVHRMLDIMSTFTERPDAPCLCMVGMMSQELALTSPVMQETCAKELHSWTNQVTKMLEEAQKKHRPKSDFDPAKVAWFLNSLWQGSMLVAKTCRAPEMIRANLKLAGEYVDSLFDTSKRKA